MLPNQNQTKTKRRVEEYLKIDIHLKQIYTKDTPCTILDEFTLFCTSIQLSIYIVLWIHVSLAYWIKTQELGHSNSFPHERLKVRKEVSQKKKVLNLPDRPCRANYSWMSDLKCFWRRCCPSSACCHGWGERHKDHRP